MNNPSSRLRRLVTYWSSLGYRAGAQLVLGAASGRHEIAVRPRGIAEPVLMRRGAADRGAFAQVFVDREYDFPITEAPSWIVDCGAHVGYASVWFASQFPAAPIVAIEPEPANAALLRRNVAPYDNVEVIEAAVWAGPEDRVWIEDPDAPSWSFRVGAQGAGAGVATVSLDVLTDQLATRCDGARGLVKVDIEGAEREVFSANSDWLDRVSYLVVELHDDVKRGCSDALYAAVRDRPHTITTSGENVVVELRAPARH